MKGARGLLISITGGSDLTLYEVDEAATRIREEVDQDANIIVGATFDEGLEGIIRVSVVATGIDHVATAAQPQADTRLAEADPEAARRYPADRRAGCSRSSSHSRSRNRSRTRRRPPRRAIRSSRPPTAAVAAAVLPSGATEDVTIRPITPKPSLFVEPVLAEPAPQEMPKTFIPPEPERAGRGPRMPRIEDLPHAGAEPDPRPPWRACRGRSREAAPVAVAAPGSGRPWPPRRRHTGATAHAGHAAAASADRMPQRPPARGPDPVSEYAKRLPPAPAPQGLDIHGRQALACAQACGRRPARNPGLPAPPGQLGAGRLRLCRSRPAGRDRCFGAAINAAWPKDPAKPLI